MNWPFPGEGTPDEEFEFIVNRRQIIIYAKTIHEANEKFQERFGYWPTEANVSD